jgi:hypothetical protein
VVLQYLISLGVTLAIATIATLGSFGSFILTANLGFLIWPCIILPAALILLFHLTWLSGASNNLKKEMLRIVALKHKHIASAEAPSTDTQVLLLLCSYLRTASDTYWSIGVDITPALVGTIVSVLIAVGSTIIPLVLKSAAHNIDSDSSPIAGPSLMPSSPPS